MRSSAISWSAICVAAAALIAVAAVGCVAPSPSPRGAQGRVLLRPGSAPLDARTAEPDATAAPEGSAETPEGPVAPAEIPVAPAPDPDPAAEPPVAPAGETPANGQPVLQAGDVIRVEVFREPELSGAFTLSADGDIRHPLLGVVPLRGLPVDRAEEFIRRQLAERYLVNPRVIVRLESAAATQVLLIGEVRNPGILSIPHGEQMTLLQAIARAGGFTAKASPNRVRVVRTRDGRRTTLHVRVADVLAGRGRHRDIPLEPNDVVTVPEVWF